MNSDGQPRDARIDAAIRAALLAVLWGILTPPGTGGAWAFGLPVIFAATALSLALTPTIHWRWHTRASARFLWCFLRESLAGGIDIARRVFHPRLPIQPGFVRYRVRLRSAAARVCLMNVISLLPGTLSVALHADILTLHVLDSTSPVQQDIEALEQRVAAVFCLALPNTKGMTS
ncbi:MAG: Na+/H+ antiporter subunit E [Legionellaceae bacterium]|nr:Na+/H+ antiporter subunit E [Legionellaceae bacterium]